MDELLQISAQALAYLGDAVLEALVRERLVLKGYEKSSKLNKEALSYVTAVNQARAYQKIENQLTEAEASVFKRGKNCSHLNIPKSASVQEYKIATGFEAVFGYLHLKREAERINLLFNMAFSDVE